MKRTLSQRIWAILLTITMVVGAMPVFGITSNAVSVMGDFEYNRISRNSIMGMEITAYTGSATHVVIPDTINGEPVIEISYRCFYNNKTIESIEIPSNVRWIETDAFYGCTNLKEIYFSNIEAWLNIDFTDAYANPLYSGGGTLYINGSPLTHLCIPNTVKKINRYAFYRYNGLKSIFIPATVKSIGYSAFYLSRSPRAVCYEGTEDQWNEISVSDYNTNVTNITKYYNCGVSEDGFVYSIEGSSVTVCAYTGNDTDVVIPENLGGYPVVSIAPYAFEGSGIESVKLPDSITELGNHAFSNCSKLNNLELSKNIETIAMYAFERCTALTEVELPDGIKTIANYAFYQCTNIESIKFSENISEIGLKAFYDCSKLKNLKLPKSIETIAGYAFDNCSAITEIELPDGIKTIGNYAFGHCTNIKSLVIPDSATTIYSTAFPAVEDVYINSISSWCALSGGLASVVKNVYINGTLPTELVIPSGVTRICESAFQNQENITTLIIPKSVTAIGKAAFDGCNNLVKIYYEGSESEWSKVSKGSMNTPLTNVQLYGNLYYDFACFSGDFSYKSCSEGLIISEYLGNDTLAVIPSEVNGIPVVGIGDAAFYQTPVESVVIPDSVTILEDSAFIMSKIKSITIHDGITAIGSYAFASCMNLTDVYIEDIAAFCNISFGVDNHMLFDYADNIYINGELLTDELYIPEGITTIGINTFYNMRSVKYVYLPKSLTRIEKNAFYNISSNNEIFYYGSEEEWNNVSINYNGNNIKDTSTHYDFLKVEGDFTYGTADTGVSILHYRGNENEITVPSHFEGTPVVSIAKNAFYNRSAIKSIDLPEGITSMGENAFCGCSSLQYFLIPDGVTKIERGTFSQCTSLEYIYVPSGVTEFNATGLTSVFEIPKVYYGNDAEAWKALAGNLFTGVTSETKFYYNCKGVYNGIVYGLNDSGAYIIAYVGKSPTVEIPETLGGCAVTEIDKSAFASNHNISSITLPSSIINIGYGAFQNSSPDKIYFKGVPKSIGSRAFYSCRADIYIDDLAAWCNITLEDDYSQPFRLGGKLYLNGELVSGELVIPDGVTKINKYAFQYLNTFSTLVLPASFKEIRYSTALDGTDIKSIYFKGTKAEWNQVYIAKSGYDWYRATVYPFYYDTYENYAYGYLDDKIILIKYIGTDTDVVVPSMFLGSPVAAIGSNAFSNNDSITSVIIPEAVVSIGEKAFASCTSLSEVTILGSPDVEANAFLKCENITRVNAQSISSWTKCSFADNLSNPIYYGKNLYVNGEMLTEVVFPEEITIVGERLFVNCKGIETVRFHEGITAIQESAFCNCSDLQRIYFPSTLTEIGSYAFSDAPLDDGAYYPGSYEDWNNITKSDIGIPTDKLHFNYAETIEEYHIGYCEEGIIISKYLGNDSEIIIPSKINGVKVVAIGDYAFYNNATLRYIEIPEGITSIGKYAFSNTSALEYIYLPASLEKIDSYAFYTSNVRKVYYVKSLDELKAITSETGNSKLNYSTSDNIFDIEGGLVYRISDDAASVFGYIGTNPDIIIPLEVGGFKVTSIADNAFKNNSSIRSVTFFDGLTNIGECAFNNCSALENINLPDTLEAIGVEAFAGCTSVKAVELPGSLKSGIKSSAFSGCTALESVVIHEGISSIAPCTFMDCTSLATIFIPESIIYICEKAFENTAVYNTSENWIDGVLYIGTALICAETNIEFSTYEVREGTTVIAAYAFRNCTNPERIILPAGIKALGYGAFMSCTNLKDISVPATLEAMQMDVFYGCTALKRIFFEGTIDQWKELDKYYYHLVVCNVSGIIDDYVYSITDNTVTLVTYLNNCQNVVIPSEIAGYPVTGIAANLYKDHTEMISVTFPSTITSCDRDAFSGCTGLQGVYISDIEAWMNISFAYNYAKTSNPLSYAKNLYLNGELVTALRIADGVTKIGYGAFYGCLSITEVSIPASVESFVYSFYDCKNIKVVYYGGTNSEWNSHDSKNTFANIPYTLYCESTWSNGEFVYLIKDSETTIVKYIGGSAVIEIPETRMIRTASSVAIEIPESIEGCPVTAIKESAFYNISFATSVSIPSSVKTIGASAFQGCSALVSINIPDGVTAIESYTFYGCSALERIDIPSGVTTIGQGAFRECESLSYVNIPEAVTSIEKYTFYNCRSLESINIPAKVTAISQYAFNYCENLSAVHIEDLDAWVAIEFESVESNPLGYAKNLYLNGSPVTEFVSSPGTTSIGDYAFVNCETLVSVTLNEGVTNIGSKTFYQCTNLNSISLSEGVMYIYDQSFYGCNSLSYVTLPDGLEYIGPKAFSNCENLEAIVLPASLKILESQVFEENEKMYHVYYKGTSWDNVNASSNNDRLDLAVIHTGSIISDSGLVYKNFYPYGETENPEFVKIQGYFGDTANIVIPDEIDGVPVLGIEERAFYNRSNIYNVDIPDSVISIEKRAFYGCANLNSIYIPQSIDKIESYTFYGCNKIQNVYYRGTKAEYEEGILANKTNVNGSFYTAQTKFTIGYSDRNINVYTWEYMCRNGATGLSATQGSLDATLAQKVSDMGCSAENAIMYNIAVVADNKLHNTDVVTLYTKVRVADSSKKYAVFTVSWDNKLTRLEATLEDSYLIFEAQKCGTFIICEIESTPGDIDGDGAITSMDSNLLKRIIAGILHYVEGSAEIAAADVNGDGTINSMDTNILKRIIAGA